MPLRKSNISVSLQQPISAWKVALPNVRNLVQRAATAAFSDAVKIDKPDAKHPPHFYVTIRLADDEEVQGLNAQFRGKDKPTNVLSFPFAERLWHEGKLCQQEVQGITLGDIILAYETVACEAKEQGKTLAAHLQHLVVHGVLHLLGFDHEEDAPATAMESLEIHILARLGVENPYEIR